MGIKTPLSPSAAMRRTTAMPSGRASTSLGVTFTSRMQQPLPVVSRAGTRGAAAGTDSRGHIINDNNFLQCSDHRRRVRDAGSAAKAVRQGFSFTGHDEIAAEFRDIRIRDVFLAADTEAALRPLEKAVSRLAFLGRERLRCYVLIGYGGETIEQAERRLRAVWEIGAMPFAMLYQPADRWIDWPAEWRALARTWSRPAAMKAEMRKVPVPEGPEWGQ